MAFSFKHKPERLKFLTNINTLDEVHRKHVENFEVKKKNLPKRKVILENLKQELNTLEKKKTSDITPDDVKRRSFLKEKIKEITNEVDEVENGFAEIDYYSRTHEVLVEYYNQLEDEDDATNNKSNNIEIDEDTEEETELETETITTNTESATKINVQDKLTLLNQLSQQKRKVKKETKRRVRKSDIVTKKKNILSFFSEKKTIVQPSTSEVSPTESEITKSPTKSDNSIEQIVSNRASLYESYMTLINKSQVVSNKGKLIRNCDNCSTEKTLIQSEGMYVCRKCGEVENIVIESEVPNHKDTVNEKPRYPYKRLIILVLKKY
jgi:hypothetical protein